MCIYIRAPRYCDIKYYDIILSSYVILRSNSCGIKYVIIPSAMTLVIHYRGVKSEGGAVDGGSILLLKRPII